MAKRGNMLDRQTFSLLYATDFADRFENQVLPALKSGFIVLADRYVYTAWARDSVRGTNYEWIKSVLGFATVPDLVIYMRTNIENLILRVIEAGGMNYWESGMDLHLDDNLFDNFKKYQKKLIDKFDEIAEKEGFEPVDAAKPVDEIHEMIKEKVSALLNIKS
jgi:dTMP kinase